MIGRCLPRLYERGVLAGWRRILRVGLTFEMEAFGEGDAKKFGNTRPTEPTESVADGGGEDAADDAAEEHGLSKTNTFFDVRICDFLEGIVEGIPENAKQPITKGLLSETNGCECDGIAEPSDDDHCGNVDAENGGKDDSEGQLAWHDLGADKKADCPATCKSGLAGAPDAFIQKVTCEPTHGGAGLQAAGMLEVAVGAEDGSADVPSGFVQHERNSGRLEKGQ